LNNIGAGYQVHMQEERWKWEKIFVP